MNQTGGLMWIYMVVISLIFKLDVFMIKNSLRCGGHHKDSR